MLLDITDLTGKAIVRNKVSHQLADDAGFFQALALKDLVELFNYLLVNKCSRMYLVSKWVVFVSLYFICMVSSLIVIDRPQLCEAVASL